MSEPSQALSGSPNPVASWGGSLTSSRTEEWLHEQQVEEWDREDFYRQLEDRRAEYAPASCWWWGCGGATGALPMAAAGRPVQANVAEAA